MKRLALILCLALTSCHGYVAHPGAINTFDSQAYDALLVAKSTIDTARGEFASGVLPPNMKPAFNVLVKAYDTAYPAYKLWRDAAQAGKPAAAYLTDLNRDMTEVSKALTAFRSGK